MQFVVVPLVPLLTFGNPGNAVAAVIFAGIIDPMD
jgi:TctA family transporter